MAQSRFSIRPLIVGAEILGLPSHTEYDEQLRTELYAAWLEYGILLFRNVTLAVEHLALSRCFGDLEMHPIVQIRAEEEPLFMKVGGDEAPLYVYDETDLKVNTIPWHRDTAYTPNICKGAMLRMVEVPSTGGETLFADTAIAYDDLPEHVQARLGELEYRATLRATPMEQTQPGALWHRVRPPTAEECRRLGYSRPASAATPSYPSVVHPARLVHPESGRHCVFLSPKEFDYFLGMGRAESDVLFAYLVAHLLQDRYVYKHSWSVHDAIVWDNRRYMHAALGNRVGDTRRGLRTTLAGELCVGRLYAEEDSSAPAGVPN
jgi:taurine dioxygenase